MDEGRSATATTEKPLSEAERVVNAFVAPSQTFRDVRRNARWWLPFLLLAIFTVADTTVIERQVGFVQVVENQMHQSPKQEEALATLTPADRAVRLQAMAKGYRFTSYAAPLFLLAFAAMGALLLWVSFSFGLGARVRYREMLAMWMYASLPRLLIALLTIVTLLLGVNTEGFDLKNPVGTNPAYYLPTAGAAVRAALSFFDVVGLWSLCLLVLGSSIVAGVSRGKAAAVVVGWWLVGMALSTGLAAAF